MLKYGKPHILTYGHVHGKETLPYHNNNQATEYSMEAGCFFRRRCMAHTYVYILPENNHLNVDIKKIDDYTCF